MGFDREKMVICTNGVLIAEPSGSFLHTLDYFHAEGAAWLAQAAADTVGGVDVERLVVFSYSFRNHAFGLGQIIEFIDHGDVDAG